MSGGAVIEYLSDREQKIKFLSYGENLVQIGPVDPEKTGLKEIIKEREKLTQGRAI